MFSFLGSAGGKVNRGTLEQQQQEEYPWLLQYLWFSLAGAWLPCLERINLLRPSNPASRFSPIGIDHLLQKEECSYIQCMSRTVGRTDRLLTRKKVSINKVSSLKVEVGSPGFTFPKVFCRNTNVTTWCHGQVPSASGDVGNLRLQVFSWLCCICCRRSRCFVGRDLTWKFAASNTVWEVVWNLIFS